MKNGSSSIGGNGGISFRTQRLITSAFMRAKGIQEALAFDGDFAAAGFTELR